MDNLFFYPGKSKGLTDEQAAQLHDQGTDQYLDFGGENQVSAADLKAMVDSGGTALVRTPTPVSPVTGATGIGLTPDLSANAYGHVYGNSRDYRRFQIDVAAGDFSDPVYDATENADDHTVADALVELTDFKWRCQDVSTAGEESEWSESQAFQTADIYIQAPSNTAPADTETDIGETPTLISSDFACVNGSDSHALSDWEVYDGVTLAYSSYDDAVNLTSLTIPEGILSEAKQYDWRVRHGGNAYGDSEWSTFTSFTTKAAFAAIIGVAMVSSGGGAGSWAWVDAQGNDITPDAGYFANHPIYAGIEGVVIDGQNMVKYPKFYYKVGTAPAGSDRAGKTCRWMSDQPADGFSVYPAFFDVGVEIDQFWGGAYEASDDAGVAVKSVAGVPPLASTSFNDFLTKCAARNTGGVDGFHNFDIWELGAVQYLGLIRYCTPDMQAAIGGDNDTGSVQNTGVSSDTLLGLHQFWSNVFMFVDGIKLETNGDLKIFDSLGNRTYVTVATGLTGDSGGYPVTLLENDGEGFDCKALFLAATLDGTYGNGTLADYQRFYQPGDAVRIARHGGNWDASAYYGLFYLSLVNTASATLSSYGSRLAKK